jgi:hemolysin III
MVAYDQMVNFPRNRIDKEEVANSLTHGLGLALSLIGFAVLVFLAGSKGSAWQVVGCTVYGATLVLLYTASTLYHSARSLRLKRVLKIVDHSAIYLLIAGTYTPFTLVNLRGSWGWTLFGLVWGLSLLGILFKIFFVEHFKIASTALYVIMGWLAVIAIKPVLHAVPSHGIFWILAGGVCYTVGVLFLAWRRLPYAHTVWHVFVLAGSVCHYFAVLFYVLPVRA